MFRRALAISAASVALAGAFSVADSSDVHACGGAFYPPPATPTSPEKPGVVTDHRTVIALQKNMTTVWDQIEYAGDPAEFAWVLPVRGAVTVGLGNDDFLNELDKVTQLEIRSPRRRCARPVDGCGGSGNAGCGSDDSAGEFDFDDGYQEDSGVFVSRRQVAGPYAAVQVHGDDESAIVGFLRAKNFAVPKEIEPVFKKYISEGFDFVAVRLRHRGSVGAMVPIRVSWKGLTPSLPLRMSAAGVDQKVGIKLFVIADARWKTKNFPTFSVDPSGLTWDFNTQKSDYVEIRDAMAATFEGRAFALESSIDVAKSSLPFIKSEPPPSDAGDVPDVAVEAASDSETGDASDDAGETAVEDAAMVPAYDTGAPPAYDAGAPPAIDPYASDLEIAFGTYGTRRVTRLRAELPVKYLDQDLELEADENQEPLDRKIQLTKASTAPVCPTAASIAGEGDSAPIRASIAIVLGAIAAVLARRASKPPA